MMDKPNINVDMDGADYLAYVKYNDERRKLKPLSPALKRFFKAALPWWTGAAVVSIGGAVVIDTIYPYVPTPWGLNYGQTIIGMLAVGLMVGWIFHGVGFAIVKVK